MELTPLDIRNQTFHKKNFGGIDPDEVKAFLETAATAFEQMSRNRTDLTERLKIAEERVNYYRQIEKTIQDAVVTMQNLRAEIEQLKQIRTNYFIRCRALIRGQEDLLSAMENDQRELAEPAPARRPAPAMPTGNVIG